jgi:hypothetical protein
VDRRPALSLDDGITDPAGQWYGQKPTTKEDQAARLEGSSLDVQKAGRVAEPHTRGCGVRMGRPDCMVVGEEAHPSTFLFAAHWLPWFLPPTLFRQTVIAGATP